MIRNLLTVDVEDWRQSTLDHRLEITERVVTNTRRLLDLFDAGGARGTFFVLGLVAERFGALVREIAGRGHEIASHGTSHTPVYSLDRETFRTDVRRSIRAIEDAAGVRVSGYRAPDFSITEKSLWALEVLAEEGLSYDSSIFPFRGPRYGIPAAFDRPCRVRCRANPRFAEFPLATVKVGGLRMPVAGGGYFRLLPYAVVRAALHRINRGGAPATCYFHPYELDTEELREPGPRVPLLLRLAQGIGRARVAVRLARLLRDFSWRPASSFLNEEEWFEGRTLDLHALPGRGQRWQGRR